MQDLPLSPRFIPWRAMASAEIGYGRAKASSLKYHQLSSATFQRAQELTSIKSWKTHRRTIRRMLKQKPKWLEPMFPWEQKLLTVNGRRMAFIDEGDPEGQPILLLSGNPSWGFLYRFMIEPFNKGQLSVHRPRLDRRRLFGPSTRRPRPDFRAPHCRPCVSYRSNGSPQFRCGRAGLGWTTGHRCRIATSRKNRRARSYEYLRIYRVYRRISLIAAAVVDVARTTHRATFYGTSQSSCAQRANGHYKARPDR